MNDKDKELYSAATPLAWVWLNNFVTENQEPIEYKKHSFLIDPMNEETDDLVVKKSAQVGFSVLAILKSFWLAKYRKLNTGYILPSQNIVKDFVAPKVDPLIHSNPEISRLVSKDSVTLKQIGNRFIYFRGAFSEREAIAISLDVLMLDELDRMPDMNIINMYDSRLQASQYAWRWRFSNPSVPSFGVDDLFNKSTQNHWFVRCPHCNHEWFMDWEKSTDKNHYVDIAKEAYVCGNCRRKIPDNARQSGRWIPAYPDRSSVGYWISQLIVPYVSAKRLIAQFEESSTDFFHNFVLGKAYQEADMLLDREVILRNLGIQKPMYRNIAMGVDVGKNKHFVIGTPMGVLEVGSTDDWEHIEYLFNKHEAIMVIDAAPEFTVPQQLIRKYPGRVFMSYYVQDKKNSGIVRWLEGEDSGVVHIDRTKAFDFVVRELTANKFKYFMPANQLEDYISHWANIYRIVEVNKLGIPQAKWVQVEGKPDHFAHAHLYYRIALEQVLGSIGGEVVETVERAGQQDPTTLNIAREDDD